MRAASVGAPARTSIAKAAFLLLLALLPLGTPHLFSPFYLDLTTKVLIFVIIIIGYDLLAGYTGMVSFGHAMFFGMGAYTAGLLLLHFTDVFWIALAAGMAVNFPIALATGYLALRTRGIYFVFLTFVFSQFFYVVAFNWIAVTGGDNGLPGIPGFRLTPLPLGHLLQSTEGYYYFVLIFTIAAYLLGVRIVQSPFGHVIRAVRENERRAASVGYDVREYKLKAYVISSMYATLAGVLFAAYQNFVSPDVFHWQVSGEIVLMALLGGMGTLVGPVIGAAFILYVSFFLSMVMEHWMIVIGFIYVVFVIFMPTGIMGVIRSVQARRDRWATDGADAAGPAAPKEG